jgi:hypothetical protein
MSSGSSFSEERAGKDRGRGITAHSTRSERKGFPPMLTPGEIYESLHETPKDANSESTFSVQDRKKAALRAPARLTLFDGSLVRTSVRDLSEQEIGYGLFERSRILGDRGIKTGCRDEKMRTSEQMGRGWVAIN